MLHHVPAVELQHRLFAEVARALRPGAPLVARQLASDELAAHPTRRHCQPGWRQRGSPMWTCAPIRMAGPSSHV
ncbi:MAG: hypothetical protein ACXWZ2_05695 [Mycobacterium sp.]